jgi:hypothetical protein
MLDLGRNARSTRFLAGLTAAALIGLTAGASAVRADEAQAKSLLKAMSDYLAAQKALSFDFDSNLDIVTKEGQRLTLASSGSVALNRPDKVRATRSGGFADVEFVFDGKTASILGKNANAYVQVSAAGTIDQVIDTLQNKYNRPMPGADLLLSNVYDEMMASVTDVKDLGSGVVGGVECNHLAFRATDFDWQIWIATGDHPRPCLYTITSTKVAGSPEYRVTVRDWKAGSDVAADDFTFKPPAGAQQLDVSKLANADELPDIFAVGGKQ